MKTANNITISRWKPHRSNKLYITHSIASCAPNFCCVHNPSNHHMKDWPQHYRDDIGVTERTCIHGVGHPDPDQNFSPNSYKWVHGCDGCCQEKNTKISS